ncbi:uncharacterized protein LOC113273193 [Papaver somniferum]|uniref:uncharacterized protein LOC113273193 n=1 Tax=Papaver somniferum TaxID=3469 RepID=UPI000E7059EF|nr:uncharacterized protein LOC113273193 [Papaver somniferum]
MYSLRDGILYRRSFLGPLLRCLSQTEGRRILPDIHSGDSGNHSGRRSLAVKSKMEGYYWLSMDENAKNVAKRCERFGIPAAIVSDNGKQLQGKNIDMLFDTFNIQKNKSTPIYPKSNGQAEVTNKTIATNLKKKLGA